MAATPAAWSGAGLKQGSSGPGVSAVQRCGGGAGASEIHDDFAERLPAFHAPERGRDIVDMHAIARAEFSRLAWADPSKSEIDYAKLPDTELAGIARGREALAVFGWKPYMHNPRLKRWLHRIDIPTHLVWGEQDGIVSTAYGEAWKAEIPGATMETIPQAGHYPHWEQPDGFAAAVRSFTDRL